jgi:hypothetical protein
MTDTKISALSAAGALAGTEVLPIVQSAATVKATVQTVRDLATSIKEALALGATITSGQTLDWNSDTFIGRRAAAGVMFGAADAAAPVAQTVSFQGARGGTDTNTAAVTTTIQGSLGTGTGTVGNVVISTGTVSASGTTAHTAAARLTINSAAATVTVPVIVTATGSVSAPNFNAGTSANPVGIYNTGDFVLRASTNGSQTFASSVSSAFFGIASGSVYVFSTTGPFDAGVGRNAAGVVEINNGTAGTWRDLKLRSLLVDATNTTAGTTGAQTINKGAGTVNFAAAATTLVVTNNLVTTASLVFGVVRTNDSTATLKNIVPATGSFTITLTAAATAETSVGFYVIN